MEDEKGQRIARLGVASYSLGGMLLLVMTAL